LLHISPTDWLIEADDKGHAFGEGCHASYKRNSKAEDDNVGVTLNLVFRPIFTQ